MTITHYEIQFYNVIRKTWNPLYDENYQDRLLFLTIDDARKGIADLEPPVDVDIKYQIIKVITDELPVSEEILVKGIPLNEHPCMKATRQS